MDLKLKLAPQGIKMTIAALSPHWNFTSDNLNETQISQRLNWVVANCVGFKKTDVVTAGRDIAFFRDAAKKCGSEFSIKSGKATVTIVNCPTELELVNRVTRLQKGCRLIVFNPEKDVDTMSLRSFEIVTACIFDRETSSVVRIFDALPRKVDEFIHIELAEQFGSALKMEISRIASLR